MFDIGDIVPLTIEIRDTSGVLANAGGTVTLTVVLPDNTSTTPTVTNPSVGRYQCDFVPTQVGRHSVRWVATGTNSSAYSDVFDVRPSDLGMIISMADAKKALNIPSVNTDDDEEIRAYVEATTRVIELWRNELIVRQTVVERHDSVRVVNTLMRSERAYDMGYEAGGATRRITVNSGPLLSVTAVERVDGSYTWDTAQLDVDTNRGTITVLFGPLFYGFIQVTYVAGYPIIPANYALAAKIILAHIWETQRLPSIGSNVFGGTTDSTPSGFGFAIPNRAAELLGGQPPVIA